LLKYLAGYPDHVLDQVRLLCAENRLGELVLKKYKTAHSVRTDKALFDYVQSLKAEYLRNAEPLSRVSFDNKLKVIQHALGTHTAISRVQGSKLKAKREIRIASLFKDAPIEFLRMITVHELAHLREKEHNKAFYQLCIHM
jgi:hypothetical protein